MGKHQNTHQTPSLRAMMLSTILLPIGAVIGILFGIIVIGASLIRYEIIAHHQLFISALARQSDQYLTETSRLMWSLAYAMIDFSFEEQTALLAQTRENYVRFSALYLLDNTGRVLAEDTDAFLLLGLDMSGERFFRHAREAEQPYFSTPFISLTTGQITVTGAVPILRDGEFQGMLVGELNLDILQQTVEQSVKGEEVAFIVDHRGTIVAHPERTWVQEQRNVGHLPLVQKGLTDETVFELMYDNAQRRWVIGSAAPIAWNWAVVMTQPMMIAIRPLLFLFLVAGIGFGLSILLFFWVQVSSLRKISLPIAHLAQKADALACQQYGDETFTAAGGQFHEILSLEHSFTRMAEAIADHTAALMETNTSLQQEIVERKLAEEQVRELNAELEHRVKQRTTELEAANRELKDFAYVTSHDLKAPLRGISRLAHWLVEDYGDAIDDKGREMANLLIGRVKRMDSLIEGILHYSRIGRIEEEREEIDLNTLLSEVLDLLSPPSHIQIAIAPDFPTIVAERTRIFQVFQNLIGNAVKFLDKPQGEIGVQWKDDGTHWTFCVSDNGPGIEQHHQERIFQIFQTLHPRDEVESTGIGLALVKKIVELYGGKIWVESTVGQGSTFFFTISKKED